MTNLMRCVCCGKDKQEETLQLVVRKFTRRKGSARTTVKDYDRFGPASAVLCDECMERYFSSACKKLQNRAAVTRLIWIASFAAAVSLYAVGMLARVTLLVYAAFAVAALAWVFWKAWQSVHGNPATEAAAMIIWRENLRAKLCEHYLSIHTPDFMQLKFHRILPEHRQKLHFSASLIMLNPATRKYLRKQAAIYYSGDGKRTSKQPPQVEEARDSLRSYDVPRFPYNPRIYEL